MTTAVITGSTRGIGFGLADALLAAGCSAVVGGRRPDATERAAAELAARHGAERVAGFPCDVTEYEQVQALWDAASARFGRVDIWINNAGLAHPQRRLWEHPPETLEAVVATNILGVLHGSKVALRGMMAQGFGRLYNMEGLGSDGRMVEGLALYGSTKYALRYLNRALRAETKGTPLIVGSISPGMVITDLLTGQYESDPEGWRRARRVFNLLAERVETVTPYLARRVLENRVSGARIRWLTFGRLVGRLLAAGFRRRDLLADD